MEIKDYARAVNYYETDKMGIVHHSNYIRFFEEARINYMKQIGCDVKKLEDLGLIIPNVDAYAKYHSPLRFGEVFTIKLNIVKFNGVTFKCEYMLFNENKKLCTTGYTTHCFVNSEMKPMSIKYKNPEIYELMINQVVNTD